LRPVFLQTGAKRKGNTDFWHFVGPLTRARRDNRRKYVIWGRGVSARNPKGKWGKKQNPCPPGESHQKALEKGAKLGKNSMAEGTVLATKITAEKIDGLRSTLEILTFRGPRFCCRGETWCRGSLADLHHERLLHPPAPSGLPSRD